jgi:hypothetical protein
MFIIYLYFSCLNILIKVKVNLDEISCGYISFYRFSVRGLLALLVHMNIAYTRIYVDRSVLRCIVLVFSIGCFCRLLVLEARKAIYVVCGMPAVTVPHNQSTH